MQPPALHLVQAFVTVAAERSFARAARTLGMTPSSVSRLVKTLEAQLGVALIHRTTRAMTLTEAGQRYFEDCRVALDGLRGAHARLRDGLDPGRGVLKLSVPAAFGRAYVVPHLSAFMQDRPGIRLDLVMTDRYVDVVGEGLTLAIRIGAMEDSSLVARRLLHNRRVLAASPAYLALAGTPRVVQELDGHACLVSTANHDGETWRLFGPGGEHALRPSGRLRADSAEAVLRFCLDGHGIAFHSAVTLAGPLARGELARVLPDWSGRETGVYCVRPPQAASPAARAFVDFLVARWRVCPALAGHVVAQEAD